MGKKGERFTITRLFDKRFTLEYEIFLSSNDDGQWKNNQGSNVARARDAKENGKKRGSGNRSWESLLD